ncbi:hypothetical protein [Variovorax sp. JS1663]|uniref:hypothetical protein n=1 Tax=Variovorax sp. JS1663 TaxID=1851577 RepID=UPI000B3490CA|nr:hypothetical protein [Variovorax sp. JS1663]OUM00534.1 hypothetical protein A8M77_20930 [Variovorax sp. JS1663]
MKHSIALLALLAAFGAHATGKPPAPSSGQTANQNTHVGITSITAALSRSNSRSTAAGGNASALGGSGYGGSLDMAGARIGSEVNVERSAPSLYGATPTQPTQPCARPGFSIGGSGRDGSGLLSIPTGTDVTCRVDNALTIMARNPRLFSDDDRLTVSCKQEDIAETQACKDLARRKAGAERAAALEDRHTRAYMAARDPGLLP